MSEKLKRQLAENAVCLIRAGRLSLGDVSPALRPLVDEILAEQAAD